MNFIESSDLTFIQKLSYIKNTKEYRGVFSKLYKVCELIFSCGKCDLRITHEKCLYFVMYEKTCLFARAIIVIRPDLIQSTIPSNLSHLDLDNTVSKPKELHVGTSNIKTQSTEKIPSKNCEVDELLKKLMQIDVVKIKDYEKAIESLFRRSIESNNHAELDKLISFSIKNPTKLPNELLSLSSLKKPLKDAYVIDFMKSKEKHSKSLFQFIFIKSGLLNKEITFGGVKNSFVTPLYLAILYNNRDCLKLLLQFHPNIKRCDEKNTDILEVFVRYYQQDDFGEHYVSLMKEIQDQNNAMNSLDLKDQLTKAFIFLNHNAIKFLIEQGGENGEKPGFLYSYKISKIDELFIQAFKSDYEYARSMYHFLVIEEKSLCEFETNRTKIVELLIKHPNIKTMVDFNITEQLYQNPNLDIGCFKLIINHAITCRYDLIKLIEIIKGVATIHSNKDAILSILDKLNKRYGRPYVSKDTPELPYEELYKVYKKDDVNPERTLYKYCLRSRDDDHLQLELHCNDVTKERTGKNYHLLCLMFDYDIIHGGFLPIHHLCKNKQYKSALWMLKKYPFTNIKTYRTSYNLLHCLAQCNTLYKEEYDTENLSKLVKHILLKCLVSPNETCIGDDKTRPKDVWDLVFEYENKVFLKVLLEHSVILPSVMKDKEVTEIKKEMINMIEERRFNLVLKPLF
ncbi:MAG: ankyrin repeat domain-containing protein [Endozoicomonadaceae bacterium]|nr:ankyrin repeat domain-containing protein [Endozoicomonadaceae bacterium]